MSAYLAVGLVVFGLGMTTAITSTLPPRGDALFTIQYSDNVHVVPISPPFVWNGKINLHYGVTNGGSVNLYVMTESQYEEYSISGSHEAVLSESGPGGAVTVQLSEIGRYHFVFERGSESQSGALTVSLYYAVKGIAVVQATESVAMFLVGSALLGLAWRARGSPGIAELWPRPSDLANTSGWTSFKWPGRNK